MLIAMVSFWSLPPLISGSIYLAVITQSDTGTRGISSEALKESSWVNGPSILGPRVIDKIKLKGPLCDIEIVKLFCRCFGRQRSFFRKMGEIQFNCKIKQALAFLLRSLPSHKRFQSGTLESTDRCELDFAEQKLLYLSQCETFCSKLKLLSFGKVITKNSRIAKYLAFIGPAGFLRSTGHISRLFFTSFLSKHPNKLDARHANVRFLLRHLHARNFHQGFQYKRAMMNLKYVVLNLR